MIVSKNQRFSAPVDWNAQILQSHPAYAPLCELLPIASQSNFPTIATLNQWRKELQIAMKFDFVDSVTLENDGRYYEVFISETLQIPTRLNNWHDFFGACSWLLYPQTKLALNRCHQQQIALHGHKERSALRHQLTLFDECGCLVIFHQTDQPVIEALRTHEWQSAFVMQRQRWSHLLPLVFGHANWEMLTRPFIGLTAKLWPILVDDDFFNLSLPAKFHFVDTQLSKQIEVFTLTDFRKQLSPLPLLGIPGWHAEQNEAFYQQHAYFRPQRKPSNRE